MDARRSRRQGWVRLTLVAIGIAVLWLGVLPRLGRLDYVQDRLERFERRGIEPAAFFYDDHPASRAWNDRIDRAVQADPAAFGLR